MTPNPFKKNPISISYTGWKRYRECKQKHFLVMTGQRPDKVDERNFLNGQVLHKVLERWFSNDEPASWIADQAQTVWDEYVAKKYIIFKSAADRIELLDRCLSWGSKLAVMIDDLGLDKYQCKSELQLERYITVRDTKVRLHGFLDILAPVSGSIEAVLDLKCSASRGVMDPYQLVFYSLLLEDDDDIVRYGSFILPALDDVVTHQIGAEHRQYLMRQLVAMAESILDDEFEPSPETANCYWCEVKAACPVMGNLPAKRGRVHL